MQKLARAVAAAGALAGVQAIAATPAAAGGHCGYYGYGYYAYYGGYYGACCPRYYEVVSYYQPVVRRVTYYQVVGYRPVVAPSYYRPWRRYPRRRGRRVLAPFRSGAPTADALELDAVRK